MQKLRALSTWDEFRQALGSASTVPEAEGILRGLAKLEAPNAFDETDLFRHKCQLLLGWAYTHPIQQLCQLASQLIIKSLLPADLRLSWNGSIDTQHREIMVFLAASREELLQKPYPRFIRQFLYQCANKWWVSRQSQLGLHEEGYVLLGPAYQDTDLLVSALVTWGCTDALISGSRSPTLGLDAEGLARQALPSLLSAMELRNICWKDRAAGHILGLMLKVRGPSDLEMQEGQAEASFNTTLTLLALQLCLPEEEAVKTS